MELNSSCRLVLVTSQLEVLLFALNQIWMLLYSLHDKTLKARLCNWSQLEDDFGGFVRNHDERIIGFSL